MRPVCRSTPLLLCAVLAASVGACTPSGSGRMVAETPPPDWLERIEDFRQRKDVVFKEDPESPLLPQDIATFEGLDYWQPDPTRRFVGPVHFYAEPERFSIVTTAGRWRPAEKVGWISIVIGEHVSILQVYRLLDSDTVEGLQSLFLPFADATSGNETYPAGRYVKLEQLEADRFVLDFNYAFNPSCAYGDPSRFACPATPQENRLPVRIEAGERGYRKEEAAG